VEVELKVRLVVLGAGAVVGVALAFLHFCTSDLERMAASADGYDARSVIQWPFALPWGLAGAVVFAVGEVVLRRLRRLLVTRAS
jgi:hypothetical protein